MWMRDEAESSVAVSRSRATAERYAMILTMSGATDERRILYEVSIPTNSVLCLAPLNFRRPLSHSAEAEYRVVSCYALFK